jgi:hypothetical protein
MIIQNFIKLKKRGNPYPKNASYLLSYQSDIGFLYIAFKQQGHVNFSVAFSWPGNVAKA